MLVVGTSCISSHNRRSFKQRIGQNVDAITCESRRGNLTAFCMYGKNVKGWPSSAEANISGTGESLGTKRAEISRRGEPWDPEPPSFSSSPLVLLTRLKCMKCACLARTYGLLPIRAIWARRTIAVGSAAVGGISRTSRHLSPSKMIKAQVSLGTVPVRTSPKGDR